MLDAIETTLDSLASNGTKPIEKKNSSIYSSTCFKSTGWGKVRQGLEFHIK